MKQDFNQSLVSEFKDEALEESINGSVVDKAEQIIKDRILKGYFQFGQKINVEKLKKEFGISITPIRDALIRLSQTGLINVSPRVGYFVTKITIKEVEDIFNLRKILEIEALETSIKNIKEEEIDFLMKQSKLLKRKSFKEISSKELKLESPHLLIVLRSGNKKLIEAYIRIYDFIELFWYLSTKKEKKIAFEKHIKINEALSKKNFKICKKEISIHISYYKDLVKKLISDK